MSKPWKRFIYGGIGALMPVLLTIVTLDISAALSNEKALSVHNLIGILIRYGLLFFIGGFIAYLHEEEHVPFKLFELGIAAPALITSLMTVNAVHKPGDTASLNTTKIVQGISLTESVYASDILSNQHTNPIIMAGRWEDVLDGVSGRVYQNKPRFIINKLSGKCIDVRGAPGYSNGDALQLWDCELSGFNTGNNSVTDQKWEFTSGGFIINKLSGKCIDVQGMPGRDNGASLILWDCELSGFNPGNNSETDQKWEVRSDGFIMNKLSKKCIDVQGMPGRDNGASLILWDCELSGLNPGNNSETDQKWFLK